MLDSSAHSQPCADILSPAHMFRRTINVKVTTHYAVSQRQFTSLEGHFIQLLQININDKYLFIVINSHFNLCTE